MKKFLLVNNDFILTSTDGLHEVFSECFAQNTDRVLLHAYNLPAAFFDISSKTAGELMQKLTDYNIQTAIIMDTDVKTSSLFSQMAGDSNRFGCVRFFETEEKGKAWLSSF